MIKTMLFVLIAMFFLSCTDIKKNERRFVLANEIKNSKWQYKLVEGCINYIQFSNGIYKEYDCEMDFEYIGKYVVKGDTLEVTEIGLASELPGSKKMVIKNRRKIVLQDGVLTAVAIADGSTGDWRKTKIVPNAPGYRKVW